MPSQEGDGYAGTVPTQTSSAPRITDLKTQVLSQSIIETLTSTEPKRMEMVGIASAIKPKDRWPSSVQKNRSIEKIVHVGQPDRYKLMMNDEASLIQNDNGFPFRDTPANYAQGIAAKYDYRISLADDRAKVASRLEDELMKVRAALGIPVHGSTDVAKTMRYYLYNRFKSPDTNLAHNKTFTHVFFTRPDLNIMDGGSVNAQCRNHTESALLWKRNPDLFKMLVDAKRNNDNNNFNMILNNSVTSFGMEDESLSFIEAGRSWNDYVMQYGDAYSGRTAGEFTVNFTDDKLYSVMNMLKLWITYIDNVARGAWNPSYSLAAENKEFGPHPGMSHVFTKTLDYASSCYVMKVAEDGSDLIYWTKYYGVFPVNTGASALSWELGQSPGDAPKLNIRFRYSYKKDFSPVALVEFNHNARTESTAKYEEPWSEAYNHSNRAYVGAPFIQFQVPKEETSVMANRSAPSLGLMRLRLAFLPAIRTVPGLTDDLVYRPFHKGGSSRVLDRDGNIVTDATVQTRTADSTWTNRNINRGGEI
jgi:hypothetical protein